MAEDLKLEGFGDVLTALRLHHGWTQEELASSIGISTGTLNKYEKGRLCVKVSVVTEIARVLGERPEAVLIHGFELTFPEHFKKGASVGTAVREFAKRLSTIRDGD